MHEASLHEANSFVTLTYANAPKDLQYRDFQLFMKRLRRVVRYVRFFVSGEYGKENGRPHWHALLFGVGFADGVPLGRSPSGESLFSSDTLSKLWGLGLCSYGSVTFASACYVAKYVLKEMEDGSSYVGDVGVFARMSRRPAVGREWLERYGLSDVLPDGRVVVNGVKAVAPKYYRRYLKARYPLTFRTLSIAEEQERSARPRDDSPERLEAKALVMDARSRMSKRKI